MLKRVVFLPWICTLASEKKIPIKSIFVTLLYDFALKHFSGNEFKRSIQVRNYVTPQSLTSRAGFKNSVSPSPIFASDGEKRPLVLLQVLFFK